MKARKRKRIKNVRIELPRGVQYDVLELAAKLHGAPSLSRYLLTAAMTYSTNYLQERRDAITDKENTE